MLQSCQIVISKHALRALWPSHICLCHSVILRFGIKLPIWRRLNLNRSAERLDVTACDITVHLSGCEKSVTVIEPIKMQGESHVLLNHRCVTGSLRRQ